MQDADAPTGSSSAPADMSVVDDVAVRIVRDISRKLSEHHSIAVDDRMRLVILGIGEASVINYVRNGSKQPNPKPYWDIPLFTSFVLDHVVDEIVIEARRRKDPPTACEMLEAAKVVMPRNDTKRLCLQMLNDVHEGKTWDTPVCGTAFSEPVTRADASSPSA